MNAQVKKLVKNAGQKQQELDSNRVDFFDAADDAQLMVSFLGEIRTANNRYKSRYVRADITDISPGASAKHIGVRNLNLKRTVLRKEVESLEAEGKLQSEPYVILGRGMATTRDGSATYYKYDVMSLAQAEERGLVPSASAA